MKHRIPPQPFYLELPSAPGYKYPILIGRNIITQIFHTNVSQDAKKTHAEKKGDDLQRRLHISYHSSHNASPLQHPPDFPVSADDRHEISGVESLETFLSLEQRVVIITDHHVKKLYGDALLEKLLQRGFQVLLLSFRAGEKSKNSRVKERLEGEMLRHQCGRNTMIVALGGGVVGDLAGFVAATYMRGIPYIQIPTTLLAMIDSSIGGKTGVNTIHGKNLIGAFWQPTAVIADLNFLKTLSQEQIINGLMEAIKIFLTNDRDQFFFVQEHLAQLLIPDLTLLEEVVIKAVEQKMTLVQKDEKESGERMILNFGHTIGHAIEQVSQYKIMHGYAVGLGILVELKISELLGICSKTEAAMIVDFFHQFKLTQRFHTGSSGGAANPDGASQNGSLTQYPSGVRKPQQNRYEIFGLARIFHTDRDEEAAMADGARRAMKSDDGCVRTHCPRKTSRSTQHPSGFPASVVDRYEIFGLDPILLRSMDPHDLLEATRHDKKRGSEATRTVLLREIGRVDRTRQLVIHEIDDVIILKALKEVIQ
jgi:3-dehydroquinate synthase